MMDEVCTYVCVGRINYQVYKSTTAIGPIDNIPHQHNTKAPTYKLSTKTLQQQPAPKKKSRNRIASLSPNPNIQDRAMLDHRS